MIKYLVCGTVSGGVSDARSRGWVQLAARRFATAVKDDIRVVCRFAEMVPDPAGVTVFVRGGDFPVEPRERDADGRLLRPDAADFDEFVRCGHAEWEE